MVIFINPIFSLMAILPYSLHFIRNISRNIISKLHLTEDKTDLELTVLLIDIFSIKEQLYIAKIRANKGGSAFGQEKKDEKKFANPFEVSEIVVPLQRK